jgi:DnaJ-class molecular chaperone
MSSHRCESCGGTGIAPANSPVSSCQFCGGHGWIVDHMTQPTQPIPTTSPIPSRSPDA